MPAAFPTRLRIDLAHEGPQRAKLLDAALNADEFKAG